MDPRLKTESLTDSLPFDNSPWILPLHKPVGMTSYDCIREVKNPILDHLGRGKGRRKLKIGHFGTLDPFAEGVLLVGTGKAMKLMAQFQKLLSKTYLGVGDFNYSTDTGDKEGEKLKESLLETIPEHKEFAQRTSQFLGEYLQKPPYFSAVKHEGKPLYEWAREGVFIDKDPVQRTIHAFEIQQENKDLKKNNQLAFETEVSSGTYIRGLWTDYCKTLGLEGHLSELTRKAWGRCTLDQCFSLDQAKTNIQEYLIRPQKIWSLKFIVLKDEEAKGFVQGQFLGGPAAVGLEKYQWVFDSNDNLLGLGVPYKLGQETCLKCDVLLCN
ncbi:MAG: hypothetical protein NXH75_10840 [Halobacteriovoraceae bacterium]|nr:hypothetical protein [Halobacteriovoraceae bacterium]